MALLRRDELEQRRERAYKVVSVPHPDPDKAGQGERVDIKIRAMFGGEWIDLIRSMKGDDWRSKNYTQLVLAFCLVGEDNKRILQDADLNAAWWKTQSKGFIIEAVDAAMEFSNLLTDTEEPAKNLPGIGGSDNSTESPPDSDIEPPEILSTTLD